MKPFDNPKKKMYCYKSDCNVVQSGFQDRANFFYVCTVCKEEVTENLKNNIKSRTDDKDTPSEGDEWDSQLIFPI